MAAIIHICRRGQIIQQCPHESHVINTVLMSIPAALATVETQQPAGKSAGAIRIHRNKAGLLRFGIHPAQFHHPVRITTTAVKHQDDRSSLLTVVRLRHADPIPTLPIPHPQTASMNAWDKPADLQ